MIVENGDGSVLDVGETENLGKLGTARIQKDPSAKGYILAIDQSDPVKSARPQMAL